MKVELIFDENGNLIIIENGEVSYHYCDYNIPIELHRILKKIPKYK